MPEVVDATERLIPVLHPMVLTTLARTAPHRPELALRAARARLFGPEFNRDTERNIEAAGLRIVEVRRRGILREIVAAAARPR